MKYRLIFILVIIIIVIGCSKNSDDPTGPSYPNPTGTFGNALSLAGENGSYVFVGNNSVFDITGPITIEAWIKADVNQKDWAGIITKGIIQWEVDIEDNAVEFDLKGVTEISSNNIVTNNTWYHIACVWDGLNQIIYINGIIDTTKQKTGTISTTERNVYIGGTDIPFSPTRTFNGQIDEVRIWNVARTQSQIQSMMNDTLSAVYYSTSDSGLIAYWRFDNFEELGIGGDGCDDVRDFTNNRNHGDIVGDVNLIHSGILQ